MSTGRPKMLDMARTTTIIGELISLSSEQEELMMTLGKEGFSYYQAGLFYDEITLDICRRVDGAVSEIGRSKKELEEALEENHFLGGEQRGIFTRARKYVLGTLLRRETSHHERALGGHYDELARHIVGLAYNNPRALSAKMLRICKTLSRIKNDIDLHWAELEERTRSERKGPMFILVLNMFIVNFFRFSNSTWFRHWIAHLNSFQNRIGERIHREVVHDLAMEDPAASPQSEPPPVGGGKPGSSTAEPEC